MGFVDLFTPENKMELNFAQLHGLTTEAVKSDLLMNGIKCDVPHAFLREVMTGEKEGGIHVTGITCSLPDPESLHKVLKAAVNEKRQQAAGQQEEDAGQQAPEEGVRLGDAIVCERKQSRRNWEDIKKTIQEGNAAEMLLPGTEIRFTLKDGRPAKAVVVGINHYNARDAVFRIVEPLTFAGMNKEHTNAGGWNKCEARRLLNEDFFPLLPDELQAVIVKHDTNQKIDGERTLSEDFLFLPSEFEVMGRNEYAEYNGVDKVFDYLKERINRLIVDEDDDLRAFWTADPSAAGTTNFCYFDHYGYSYDSGAANGLGLAPLFVIE